jgi:hypothetical protein
LDIFGVRPKTRQQLAIVLLAGAFFLYPWRCGVSIKGDKAYQFSGVARIKGIKYYSFSEYNLTL